MSTHIELTIIDKEIRHKVLVLKSDITCVREKQQDNYTILEMGIIKFKVMEDYYNLKEQLCEDK